MSKIRRIKKLVEKIPSLDHEIGENMGIVINSGSVEFCEVGNVILKIRKILETQSTVKEDLLEAVSLLENTGQNMNLYDVEAHARILREEIEGFMECSRCKNLFEPPHGDYEGYCTDCIETTYIELEKARKLRDQGKEST